MMMTDMSLSPTAKSEAEGVAALDTKAYAKWTKNRKDDWFNTLEHHWPFWRRPAQTAPDGDWRVWLMLAGRGFGKTRAGAEWVRGMAESRPGIRIALVAASLGEARQIMVEGESGLLAISPDASRPDFEASNRRLKWHNGSIATLYSAAEPESLRGPEHHIAWCDELAKWDRAEASWDMLGMTLRLGNQPQIVATTTPRPVPLVRRLLTEQGVVMTHGRSADNRAHISKNWFGAMKQLYGGTRLGRQELDGEMIADVAGALWSRQLIEDARIDAPPEMRRVVIGVDPPASAKGDACGIVAAGLGADGRAYVLADHSVAGKSPEGWARAVANACAIWSADRVVAEANNGGNMVEATLRGADMHMPVKRVHATHGKTIRAEPVAALFEAGRARLAGRFPALEDELCGLITGGSYEGPGRSPDRADACVWALTELMLGKARVEPRVRLL